MRQLDNINLQTAKSLLGGLKEYADMTKKLGNRGRSLFEKKLTGKKSYVIEYFSVLGEDAAWLQAEPVFEKSFGQSPKREEVDFIAKDAIKGGMKIYCDDSMVDLSFKKVENLMQK